MILFLFIIDGIKIFVEVFSKPQIMSHKSNGEKVTAIIAAYNEERCIVNTIESVSRVTPNIIVVDDGSTDRTAELAVNHGTDVRLVQLENGGKPRAINIALEKVFTPYTLICDADIEFGKGASLPTSWLDNGDASAVSFNIKPMSNGKKGLEKRIINFQKYEYARSMMLGRRLLSKSKSVNCISGAAGLYKTERLKEFGIEHSGKFPGEDLERTLIELDKEGKVMFSDEVVYTDVPKSIKKLSKQRILGWWPGLYRNFFSFFRLFFKKNSSLGLRAQLGYSIFSNITDPLKFVSLIMMFIYGSWVQLLSLYGFYLIFDSLVYTRMRKIKAINKDYPLETIFLAPFYSLYQLFTRVFALVLFIFFNTKWKSMVRIVILLGIFLLFSQMGKAQNNKSQDPFTVVSSYQRVMDSRNIGMGHTKVYVSWKDRFFVDIQQGSYDHIRLGSYFQTGSFNNKFDLRIRRDGMFAHLRPQTVIKPFTVRAHLGEYISFNNKSFPLVGIGSDFYYGNYDRISLDCYKEFGREYATAVVLKWFYGKKGYNGFWVNPGILWTSEDSWGYFFQAGWKWIMLNYGDYSGYDFTNYDRKFIGAGVRFRF